jgi:hypothetical protein
MAPTIRKFRKLPVTVDAAQYAGTFKSAVVILNWVARHKGTAFPAVDLHWRNDMGCYWHKTHGFIYLPQGARRPGLTLEPLKDDELVVRTNAGTYALVFPGDFVVRSRSGFYPLTEESFLRSHVSTTAARGTNHPDPLPAV